MFYIQNKKNIHVFQILTIYVAMMMQGVIFHTEYDSLHNTNKFWQDLPLFPAHILIRIVLALVRVASEGFFLMCWVF